MNGAKRFKRAAWWAITNAGLISLAYFGVNGDVGCARVLHFLAPIYALALFAVFLPDAEIAKQKPLPVPSWLNALSGWGLVLFLVWHGWIWTALAFVAHETGIAYINKKGGAK